MMSFSGSHTLGNPCGSPAEMAWPWVSTKPCIATMPSSLQSRYSPGATVALPAARARIFSAIVIPIETSSGLSGSPRPPSPRFLEIHSELLQSTQAAPRRWPSSPSLTFYRSRPSPLRIQNLLDLGEQFGARAVEALDVCEYLISSRRTDIELELFRLGEKIRIL